MIHVIIRYDCFFEFKNTKLTNKFKITFINDIREVKNVNITRVRVFLNDWQFKILNRKLQTNFVIKVQKI